MKVLVTGGAGYIGSMSVRALLDAGHEVVVLDSLEKGHLSAVDERATLHVGDIGERADLDVVLPGADAVLHCAGYIEVAESQSDPERYFSNNARRPLVLLKAMVDHGVPALVFSSTAAVYGEPAEVPITEEAPTDPVNVYGASKLQLERSIERVEAEGGLRAIRFRYFNAAGAMPDGSLGEAHQPETHIIPRILRAMAEGRATFEIYGDDYPTPDGTCVRDYIHVLDLAEAHRLGVERLHAGAAGGVFNLGNGVGYSNLEVVNACAEATQTEIAVTCGPRRDGDPAVLVAASAKARDELGWAPAHSDLSGIVADAWSWHSSHPTGYHAAG